MREQEEAKEKGMGDESGEYVLTSETTKKYLEG